MGIFDFLFGKKEKPISEMDPREKYVKMQELAVQYASTIKSMEFKRSKEEDLLAIAAKFYEEVKAMGFDPRDARQHLAAALRSKGIGRKLIDKLVNNFSVKWLKG